MDFVVTITSLGFVSGLEKSLIFFGNIKHNLAFSFLFRPTKFANWLDWTWQRLKSRFLYWLAVDQNTQGNIYNTDPLLKKKQKTKKNKELSETNSLPSQAKCLYKISETFSKVLLESSKDKTKIHGWSSKRTPVSASIPHIAPQFWHRNEK